MIQNRIVLVCILLLHASINFAKADESEQQRIQQQFVEYYTASSDEAEVIKLQQSMQEDGTWKNIDYKSKQRGGWPTLNHLKNVAAMAAVYANQNASLYKNAKLRDDILKGINHWLDNDYTNPNWWQPRIGIPENLAIAFILLGDDLPGDVLERAKKGPLKRTKIGMTGQNKVWLSGIAFMKGHLYGDTEMMTKASESIWEELRVSTDEGIQPDWSFHQHGPQQQFGNYGLSYGNRMIMWANILRDTPYALAGGKLEILRNYQLHGASWVLWKDIMDYSACGRQIEKGEQTRKANGLKKQLEALQSIDPAFKKQYKARLSTKNKLLGHKSFWRSEMAIHRTKHWYASVKMSSKRMIGAETCNSENMQGLHQGDGTLLLYKSGEEYKDIVPLWNWNRLPGTTCDQKYGDLTPLSWNKGYGNSNYSGVLGDTKTGMAAMQYKRGGLQAKKAYFFMDDAIVCLGSDINGSTSGNVLTSVQQSLLADEVFSSEGLIKKGRHTLQAGSWVYHNGFGYLLLDSATCSLETVRDNWNKCYPDRGDKPVKGEVFSLYMNHGKAPKNKDYAYMIFPLTAPRKMEKTVQKRTVEILQNTNILQAVETRQLVMSAFYKPGAFVTKSGTTIKVNQPCLMMISPNGMYISDPLHKAKQIELKIDEKTYTVNLPQGDEMGKSVRVVL